MQIFLHTDSFCATKGRVQQISLPRLATDFPGDTDKSFSFLVWQWEVVKFEVAILGNNPCPHGYFLEWSLRRGTGCKMEIVLYFFCALLYFFILLCCWVFLIITLFIHIFKAAGVLEWHTAKHDGKVLLPLCNTAIIYIARCCYFFCNRSTILISCPWLYQSSSFQHP